MYVYIHTYLHTYLHTYNVTSERQPVVDLSGLVVIPDARAAADITSSHHHIITSSHHLAMVLIPDTRVAADTCHCTHTHLYAQRARFHVCIIRTCPIPALIGN